MSYKYININNICYINEFLNNKVTDYFKQTHNIFHFYIINSILQQMYLLHVWAIQSSLSIIKINMHFEN